MTIEHDRAIARKMSKLRMFDIAQSVHGAARRVIGTITPLSDGGYALDMEAYSWLVDACEEWDQYVKHIQLELGI